MVVEIIRADISDEEREKRLNDIRKLAGEMVKELMYVKVNEHKHS